MGNASESHTYAIFSALYLPHLGGVERYTDGLATALAARGYRVVIVTCALDGDDGVAQRDDGITVCRIPARIFRDRLPVPARGFRKSRAWRFVEAADYDGVIVNTRLYLLSLYGVQFARAKGMRPIVIEHGSGRIGLGNPLVDFAFHRYEKWLFKRIAACKPQYCGVSRRAAEWLLELGIMTDRVIPNAINAAEFRGCASRRKFREELGIDEKTRLVAFTGRLIREKGIWTLAETVALLRDRGADVHFVLAGDGPERAQLEAAMGEKASIVGSLDRSDIAALLMQADIFCFPSIYPEGLPTSLLEAAVCEAYIVTSDVAGSRDVVPDDSCGKVLTASSASSFADAIAAAADCAGDARLAALKCRRHVEEKLNWDVSAERALELLQQPTR